MNKKTFDKPQVDDKAMMQLWKWRQNNKTAAQTIKYLQEHDFDYIVFHPSEFAENTSAVDSIFSYYDEAPYKDIGHWGITYFFKCGTIIKVHDKHIKIKGNN